MEALAVVVTPVLAYLDNIDFREVAIEFFNNVIDGRIGVPAN